MPEPAAKSPKMYPMGDHLVVTLIEEDKTIRTKSGVEFFVPDSAQDKPNRGEVVAVGEGRVLPDGTLRGIKLKPKDRILFSKYAGNPFSLVDGEGVKRDYLSISYDDVLVVIG